jgi:cbb3-type cytochrome oxidase subunit 3
MPNSGLAEIYFIAAMFVLILIVCSVAVYFFFRTYNREKRERAEKKSIQNPKSEIQN